MPEKRRNRHSQPVDLKALSLEILFHSALDYYYDPKPWESSRVYRMLGVRKFKEYVPNGSSKLARQHWKDTGKPLRLKDYKYATLFDHERETRASEAGHIGFGLMMMPLTEIAFQANVYLGSAFLLSNVLLNGYPILLQRYNRGILYRAMARAKS